MHEIDKAVAAMPSAWVALIVTTTHHLYLKFAYFIVLIGSLFCLNELVATQMKQYVIERTCEFCSIAMINSMFNKT